MLRHNETRPQLWVQNPNPKRTEILSNLLHLHLSETSSYKYFPFQRKQCPALAAGPRVDARVPNGGHGHGRAQGFTGILERCQVGGRCPTPLSPLECGREIEGLSLQPVLHQFLFRSKKNRCIRQFENFDTLRS